jgi:hypothetical protein
VKLIDEVALQEHAHRGPTCVFVCQVEVDECETATAENKRLQE